MAANNDRIKVLFLCTGNACRSQMAEGWAKTLKTESIEAFSAGIRPIGVSEKSIEVMGEAGVDISNQRSEHVDEYCSVEFDYVVTLCGNAAESCPVFGGGVRVVHKPFVDPYFASGTEEEVMAVFRKVRDDIREFVESLPGCLDC